MGKIKCTCECHNDPNIIHMIACCHNGWIEEEEKSSGLTIEKLREVVKELYEKGKIMNDFPVREISPGLHQIGPLITGDGGRKMFEDALKEEGRRILSYYKPKKNKK